MIDEKKRIWHAREETQTDSLYFCFLILHQYEKKKI